MPATGPRVSTERSTVAGLGPRPVAAAVGFVVTAIVYLLTMCRTVGFIDRGELSAVACTLGVAHPTGYPTLTLLGFLASRLWPARPILALNALAALLVAAGAAVMALAFDAALEAAQGGAAGRARGERGALSPPQRRAITALAALFTALVPIWWLQANGFEAYALHALFLPLVLWLFLRYVGGRPAEAPTRRAGRWFAFALGLSFTNHMTTVLLAPALVFHFFAARGLRRGSFTELARLVPFFLLGLVPYAWLPLRAAMRPAFSWGNTVDLARFLDHVTAWQYRVWLFGGWEVFRQQAGWFFADLPRQTAWAGLALALFGLWELARRSWRHAALTALIFAATVLYAGSYQIRDIEPYFLAAVMAVGLCAAAGLAALHRRFGPRAALALGAALVVAQAALHYRECDESGNHLVEDLTTNLLRSLPPDAVVFTTLWDYTLSAAWYLQAVEQLRPDVLMVDVELLRRRWYLDQLERQAPWFMAKVAPEVARFRREVEPFERHRPFRPATIEAAYVGMVDSMIARHQAERPVFLTSELAPHHGRGFRRVPWGLARRVTPDSSYLPQEFPAYRFRPWPNRANPYVATVSYIYGRALAERMLYEQDSGRPELARRYGDYALRFAPPFGLEDLPPMALEGRELTAKSVEFFARLKQVVKGG